MISIFLEYLDGRKRFSGFIINLLVKRHGESDKKFTVSARKMNSTMNFALPAAAPIEEISNALYSKGIKFMVTHNVDVKLPEVVFDGATFRISPRSIEGNGIIAKLEYVPKTEIEARSDDDSSRFFKKIKKISEFEIDFNSAPPLSRLRQFLQRNSSKERQCWLLLLLLSSSK